MDLAEGPGKQLPRQWIKHLWLDFHQMSDFEQDPLVIVGGSGMRVRADDGREFIDAIGGAMVSNLGYGDAGIRAAMHASIDRQDFWPVLHAATPSGIRLAKRLAEILPGDLNTSFFVTGGSEATETAMKMARQYHRNNGQPGRYKVISRYWSYHGATMQALSASGVSDRRRFEPLPSGVVHAMPPYCYRCPWGREPDSCSLECVRTIEDIVTYEGAETIAAIIVDPVMAAAGVLVPPKSYYKKLRELCDRTGILLIFDEVLTGFGRLGSMFACNHYDVVPDLVCMGKGITSGYAPFAATAVRDHIAQAFRGEAQRTFVHGHTFGGYPLGCDTALAVIERLTAGDLIATAARNGEYFGERLRALGERYPIIGDVRGLGMLWGIEFVRDRGTRERFPSNPGFATEVRAQARALGMLTRGSSHVLILAPALTASREDLDEIVAIAERAIATVASKLSV